MCLCVFLRPLLQCPQTCIFFPSTCCPVLDHHWPLLQHGASHCCWKKIGSKLAWIEALWALTALCELFCSIGLGSLLHALPSCFLCGGDFAFCFQDCPLWLGLLYLHPSTQYSISLLFALLWIIVSSLTGLCFTWGILWFPKLTLLLVSVPPLYGLFIVFSH